MPSVQPCLWESFRLCCKQAKQAKCPSLQRGESLDRKVVFSPRLYSALAAAGPCPRGDGGFTRFCFWWNLRVVTAFFKKNCLQFHASILRARFFLNLRN